MDDAKKNALDLSATGKVLIFEAPSYQMSSSAFWPNWALPGINGSNRKKNT